MITSTTIKGFGPVKDFQWKNTGRINLVIGPNKSGKTYLLKALYSAIKTIEAYKRGKEVRREAEILFDKLYWTYQPDQLGKLVSIGSKTVEFAMTLDGDQEFAYTFGPSANKQVTVTKNTCQPRQQNSIFLPAKEIISLQQIIVRVRDDYQEFGFDDTYYDLAKALTPSTKGRNYKEFSVSRTALESAIGGHIEYDTERKEWAFREGKQTISIAMASEGVKKLSILDALLGNHYLSKDSIIFIDEPECALHPRLVSQLMDIIVELTKAGLQFFIASHSYFVIKKLYLLAHQKKMSIPVVSFDENGGWGTSDLREEMPQNPIIEESIRLYTEEINL